MGDGGGRAAGNGGMGGGGTGSRGGSRGSSGGGASPGRSTPGSPSASDGKRGSSMGAGGGSAPGTSSGGGNGGSSTNPGRPGGEAGPSVDGSDGYSGYSGNSDTSSFGSSSGGSESIRGAKAASFSFNSPEAGEMASFRADRQAARSLDGVGSFGLNGTDQGGVASGLVAGRDPLSEGDSDDGQRLGYVRNENGNPVTNQDGGYVATPGGFKAPSADMVGYMASEGTLGQTRMENGLNVASPGYRTVVGDIGLADNQANREAMMSERAKVQPDTRVAVERAVMDANNQRVAQAKDDGIGRALMESVAPMGGLIGLGMDMNDNRLAAEGFNSDLGDIQNQYSIQDGYFGSPDTVDATGAVVGDSTGGLLGNPNKMADVALGIDSPGYNNSTGVNAGSLDGAMTSPSQSSGAMAGNRGGGSTSAASEFYAQNGQPAATPNRNGFGYGRLTNYGSYRRRVLNRLG